MKSPVPSQESLVLTPRVIGPFARMRLQGGTGAEVEDQRLWAADPAFPRVGFGSAVRGHNAADAATRGDSACGVSRMPRSIGSQQPTLAVGLQRREIAPIH